MRSQLLSEMTQGFLTHKCINLWTLSAAPIVCRQEINSFHPLQSCSRDSKLFQLLRLCVHFTLFQIICTFKVLVYLSISEVDQFALCSGSLSTLPNSNGSSHIMVLLLSFLTSYSKQCISLVLFLKDLIMLITQS